MSTSPARRRFSRPASCLAEGDDWYSKSSFNYRHQSPASFAAAFRRSASASTTRWASCPRRGVNNGELHLGAPLSPELALDARLAARNLPALPVRELHRGAAAGSSRATWTGTGRSRSTTARSSRSASTRTSRSSARRSRSTAGATSASARAATSSTRTSCSGEHQRGRTARVQRPLLDRRLLRRLPAWLRRSARRSAPTSTSTSRATSQFNDIDLPQGAFTTTLITGPRELLPQHQGVPQRAAAVQHRRAAVELERAAST